jgi:hypothetical protein
VRLRLTDATYVVLADPARGIELLSAQDAFLAAMTPLDRTIRLGGAQPADEAALVALIASQVRAFGPDEVEILRAVLTEVARELVVLRLALPWPRTIEVVRTTGREEIDAALGIAYTRGNTIVFNGASLTNDPASLVRHELFHVLTRNAPALRDALYAVIGYRPVDPITLPPELEARRLTNPDAPIARHVIRVHVADEYLEVANFLLASRPYTGGHLFEYLEPSLVAVDTAGAARVLAIDEVEGYFEQVGRNTEYVIQPEEILADNFALLLRGDRDVPTPRVLTDMLAVLRDPPPESLSEEAAPPSSAE